MKKGFLYFVVLCAVLYLGFFVFLASGPFQRRLLSEIKSGLLREGLEVEIQSVDFAFLSPKLYLNRVSLQGTPESGFRLASPLEVDKVKIEIQLLGFIFKEIVFEEVSLYHPKIVIPQADALYKRLSRQLSKRKPIRVKGPSWPLVFKKIGIVDSQFEVTTQDPQLSIRSRNLTAFLSQTAVGQQGVELTSSHFEFKRETFEIVLTKLDCDLDFTGQSVRANRLLVEGKGVKLNWKGAFSLPSKQETQSLSFHLSHETELDLALLDELKELGLPKLKGSLSSSGTLHVSKDNYVGSGKVDLINGEVEKIKTGDQISLSYRAEEKDIKLLDVSVKIGDGEARTNQLQVSLGPQPQFSGKWTLNALKLEKIFSHIGLPRIPLVGLVNGTADVSGQISEKWLFSVEPQLSIDRFRVFNGRDQMKENNRVLTIPRLQTSGKIEYDSDQGTLLNLNVGLLQGTLALKGGLGGPKQELKFAGTRLDLKDLGGIAQIPFEGRMDIEGAFSLNGEAGVDVAGEFGIVEASISELELGSVRGKLQFRKDLLSFSGLELKALESARGQGFVDFSDQETIYRFDINAPRVSLNQVWDLFKREPLPVQKPVGGEVGARVLISGGQNEKDFNLKASGQVRSFEWYGEKWMSANIGINYSPDKFTLEKGVFLKRSGSLEVKALLNEESQELQFYTSGLRIEDLNHIGNSPLQGEITGRLVFEGGLNDAIGNGEILLSKLEFRGEKLSNARVSLKSNPNQKEYVVTVPQEGLEIRLVQGTQPFMFFKANRTEIAPYLSAWLGKEISPLSHIRVSGEGKLEGSFNFRDSLDGEIRINELVCDFSGRQLKNSAPVRILLHKGDFEIPNVNIKGEETELNGSIAVQNKDSVKASLKGKIPLDTLQPFIPGIDYASGWLTANLQASGPLDRYNLFGALSLSDANFRIQGMQDDFKATSAQIALSPLELNIQKFQSRLGGGEVAMSGSIAIARFTQFSPNLNLFVSKSKLQFENYLKTTLTGELALKGERTPYLLQGRLQIDDLLLTSLSPELAASSPLKKDPALTFDIKAESKKGLLVKTDILSGELSGDFNLVGTDQRLGLLGKTDIIKGELFFKDTPFDIVSGTAKFERPDSIYPRFNLAARSIVREQKGRAYQDYEVNLQALGTPDDYKIRLTSNPPLVEQDLISLLVLGVTTQGQEGNYFDLGTAIMGQSPIRSKIQSELGVDIKVQSTPGQGPMPSETGSAVGGTGAPGSPGTTSTGMVPAFRIEKGLSKSTRLSFSNTLDQNQARELRVEQMLDDNITLNATAGDRSRNNTQARPGDSFGLDIRYRFSFD